MSGFADLVQVAQPYLGRNPEAATEGTSWRWELEGTTDSEGAVIDLSSTTGVCKVTDEADGSEVITIGYTGTAAGSILLEIDETATVGLANGLRPHRRCRWGLRISDGVDVVQVWGPQDSPFHILAD